MIEKPTVTELLTKAENRYELVIMTARRARQIAKGAKPLTDVAEESAVTKAANEIVEGKIRVQRANEEIQEKNEITDEKESSTK